MRVSFLGSALLLAACSSGGHEVAPTGTWTWPGNNCAEANMRISPTEITMTLPNQGSAIIYDVLPGPHATKRPEEYILHLRLRPQPGMDSRAAQRIRETGGRMSILVVLDGRTMTPTTVATRDTTVNLDPSEHTAKLFTLVKCA